MRSSELNSDSYTFYLSYFADVRKNTMYYNTNKIYNKKESKALCNDIDIIVYTT